MTARRDRYDAIIVGSGPNGLAAAVTLALEGRSVLVAESRETIGGGTRTEGLTLPGFHHDICSTIHPLGVASPFFRNLPKDQFSVKWIHPGTPLAHPLDNGTAAVLHRSLDDTAAGFGVDGRAYRRLFFPLVENWQILIDELLGPFPPRRLPSYPMLARFGLSAISPARRLAENRFTTQAARALFAGIAAHSFLPLEKAVSAAFGLVLGMLGHAVGWPIAGGGSQSIAGALAAMLEKQGGELVTSWTVQTLAELPPTRAVLLDLTPKQVLKIAARRLPESYAGQLRSYRYNPGVFKIDYALSEPIPWKAAPCRQAGTVHVGGTLAEIAAAERQVSQGKHPEHPFVIVAQQSLFDPSRAPAGKHTGWAYCHVPNGSAVDMTGVIEEQIERFAPGFRDCILARHTFTAHEMEGYNPNYVGGDINGGVQDLRQLFTRPVPRLSPYTTPVDGLYLCSSATPPGGGVHGLCGWHAAQVVKF